MRHFFNRNIANEIGLVNAIVLQHIAFWVDINAKKNTNFYDGKYWTYTTLKGAKSKGTLKETFPYLTEYKIRDSIVQLEELGYIERGNYNKKSFDKTTWYTITEKAINLTSLSGTDLNATMLFDVEVACEFGLNQAIVLDVISGFVHKNVADALDKYNVNEQYWTICSYPDLVRYTKCLTLQNVKTAVQSLIKKEIIMKDNHSDSSSFDKSSWFSLTSKGEEITGVCCRTDKVKNTNHDGLISKHPSVNFETSTGYCEESPSVNFETSRDYSQNIEELFSKHREDELKTPIPNNIYADTLYSNTLSTDTISLEEDIGMVRSKTIKNMEKMKLKFSDEFREKIEDMLFYTKDIKSLNFEKYHFDNLSQQEIVLADKCGVFNYLYFYLCSLGYFEFDSSEFSPQEIQDDMRKLKCSLSIFEILNEIYNCKLKTKNFGGKVIDASQIKDAINNLYDQAKSEQIISSLLSREPFEVIHNPKAYLESCILNSLNYWG